jgi:predicted DNA-binding transcriptional regulator AlpA
MQIYKDNPTSESPRLAYRPREMAALIGLSEKALFDRTFPRGDIPAIKLGSRVVYFAHQIQAWSDREFARQQKAAQQAGNQLIGGNPT